MYTSRLSKRYDNQSCFRHALCIYQNYFFRVAAIILNKSVFKQISLFSSVPSKPLDHEKKLQDQLSSEGVLICYMFYCYSVTKIFFDEHKQAFHDRFSQTYCVVVYKKNKSND